MLKHIRIFMVIFGVTVCILGVNSARFTDQETEAIGKLYRAVESSLYLDHMKTKEYLVHWIRDQKGDVNKAKEKLMKSIEWRRHNEIDTVLTDTGEGMQRLGKTLPFAHHGYDVIGRPVLDQEYTIWDFRKLAIAGPPERKNAIRYYAKINEAATAMVRQIEKKKPEVNQWILIGDLRGYNLRQHGCLSCIPLILDYVRVYESNYPDTLKHIIAINAPRIVDTLLNLVKPIMSPATREQFLVYTADQKTWDFVDKVIPSSELLPKYGGTRTKRVKDLFP